MKLATTKTVSSVIPIDARSAAFLRLIMGVWMFSAPFAREHLTRRLFGSALREDPDVLITQQDRRAVDQNRFGYAARMEGKRRRESVGKTPALGLGIPGLPVQVVLT